MSRLRILFAGAVHLVVDALAGIFKRESGLRLVAEFASSDGVKAV